MRWHGVVSPSCRKPTGCRGGLRIPLTTCTCTCNTCKWSAAKIWQEILQYFVPVSALTLIFFVAHDATPCGRASRRSRAPWPRTLEKMTTSSTRSPKTDCVRTAALDVFEIHVLEFCGVPWHALCVRPPCLSTYPDVTLVRDSRFRRPPPAQSAGDGSHRTKWPSLPRTLPWLHAACITATPLLHTTCGALAV